MAKEARMTIKNKRNRGKFGGYLFELDGQRINKQKYWAAKLNVAIDKKADFFMNVRIGPEESQKLLFLMGAFRAKSPSDLMKKIITENMKLFNLKDKKIQVLMELWDVANPIELQSRLIEESYKDVQIKLLALENRIEQKAKKK